MEVPVSVESSESDDEDVSSSKLEKQLEHFREKWKEELTTKQSPLSPDGSGESEEPLSVEAQAMDYFQRGVNLERIGSVYEAILWYRKAIRLDPDIEIKMFKNDKANEKQAEADELKQESEENEENLIEKFRDLLLTESKICQKAYAQQGRHISDLPYEVLLSICHWIVSDQLDARALDRFSSVCRGFFLCARDGELWRKICVKTWGVHAGDTEAYGSWRNMYFNRPHLFFDGVYISKATYMRQGEAGLDSFYRPWQFVEYYRYFRFFPDGSFFMMTSPMDPKSCVQLLKTKMAKNPDSSVVVGHYRLTGDRVSGLATKVNITKVKQMKRGKQIQQSLVSEQLFYMEFVVEKTTKKRNYKLAWTNYEIRTKNPNNTEEVYNFPLNAIDFPPFFFSRVRSYAAVSTAPLD